MSTLKTNNFEHLDASSPNITLGIGGGVNISGIATAETGLNVTGGLVGIGTDNPSWGLDLQRNSNTQARFIRNDAGDSFIRVNSHTGNIVGLQLGDNTDVDKQMIRADNTNNALIFNTANSEKFRITSTGGVGVGTTTVSAGVNVSVAGTIRVQDSTDATQYLTINHQGINFQNTGAGSSTASSAHLLDDYEEGTFTPFILAGVTNPTLLADAAGVYTKIGRLVMFTFDFSVGSGTVNGDTLSVGGLPFVSGNIPDNFAAGIINYNNILVGFTELRGGHISTGQNSMVFYNGTGAIKGNTSGVNWTTSKRIIVTGVYNAA